MSNTLVKVASVFLVVLALPTASFARGGGGGGGGGARGGGSATTGLSTGVRPNPGLTGAAQQLTDPSGMGNANRVAPIAPPRISVPTIPQFK
jgi:hypothetical protein